MLLVLPLLLAVLLGTVEFSLWLAAQQQVTLASREGARVAATGGSADDVGAAVHLVLGDARFQQANVQSVLTDTSGNPVLPGAPVSVQVQLPVPAVVPDLLIFIGLSIRDQFLVSQTVMRKE
jgi:Flp pilus assembly protein TadG